MNQSFNIPMKNFNLNGQWPILAMVILFIAIPMSTLPGFFDFMSFVLGLITLGILVLLVWTLVASRRKSSS